MMLPHLQPTTYNLQPRGGFTLIEVTVASGLFVTAIVIIIGIMAGVSNAQRKITNIHAVQDNVRFATELMTKEMRMGRNFALTNSCTMAPAEEISYRTWFNPANIAQRRVYYRDGTVLRRITACATCPTPCGSATEFLGGDVALTSIRFAIRGGTFGPSDGQPVVTVALSARSTDPKVQFQSETDLQTTVVQRFRDLSTASPPPTPPPPPPPFETQVSHNHDDAEEDVGNGNVDRGSGDLELTVDGGDLQEVGMRFRSVTIPPGALITNAWIRFVADESNSGVTNLTFFAEATDDAAIFSSSDGNITGRTKTAASVAWTGVPSWTTGTTYQTGANLAPIIQEVINRPGWASGNDLVIIVTGTGTRTAESHDGAPALAPFLHVEYQ